MSKSVKAIYEDGVFKPLEPVHLAERQQVVVTIPDIEVQPSLQTGAELVAYWQKEGVFGSHPEITDSVAYAQALRRDAETRHY
jgi:predicted DNA-binding antitoxin AbrB/MazE fold protein